MTISRDQSPDNGPTTARIAPLQIGPVRVDLPALLAPMAGYSDYGLRVVCVAQGCELTFTEVVSADGIARGVKPTLFMLERHPDEKLLVGHIYGADPSVMAEAARRMEAMGRFCMIDINCGCPVRKVVHKGAGAALMHEPQRIHDIVAAVRAAVTLPVTVKTRIGSSPTCRNIHEVADAAQQGGAHALHLHGRFTSVRHAGEADWDAIAEVKRRLHIPVVGNGGIRCAEDAVRLQTHSGVDGVMIGRRAVGNPWIFREIRAAWEGLPCPAPTLRERLEVIRRHLRLCVELRQRQLVFRRASHFTTEQAALLRFRGQLVRYLAGCRGMKQLMREMDQVGTVDELMRRIEPRLEAHYGEGPCPTSEQQDPFE